MHEIGVLSQVVKEVEAVAKRNDIDRVDGVVLQIGELTGMVPKFFEEYYDMVVEGHPILEGSKLGIEIIPGEGRCLLCGTPYNIAVNEGFCPHCGSHEKDILSGTQFLIKELIITEHGGDLDSDG